VISAAENSNKFQKSVEDMVTLGPRAEAKLVFIMGRSNPKRN
jgi:hypothetical protein